MLLPILAGAVLGGLFAIFFERRILAIGLLVAALIYVGFALAAGDGRWLLIEVAGVAIFAGAAWLGLRSAAWLALGWVAHVAWDVGLHLDRAQPVVGAWYPLLCVGFDLIVAGVLVRSAMMKMSLVAVISAAVSAAVWPGDALGQAALDRRCWAPRPTDSERTHWYDAEGGFVRDTSVRSVASLVRRFAGTYRLLVVTSEGSWEREITEYRMTLAPPTPAQEARIARIPAAADGRLQVPLVAVLAYEQGVRGRKPVTGRPYGDLFGEVNFEYWPSRGKIGFNVGLGFDSGTLFQVTDVMAAGSFRGRWSDGGYGVSELATSIEPMLEQARGYFCALPR